LSTQNCNRTTNINVNINLNFNVIKIISRSIFKIRISRLYLDSMTAFTNVKKREIT